MVLIKLTQDKEALIDDEDCDFVSQYKWYTSRNKQTYYAVRDITIQDAHRPKNIKSKRKHIHMHREIMKRKLKRELQNNEEVDHINGDGFDNRRCNLRLCDTQKNSFNKKKQRSKATSIYKGVSWKKDRHSWHARIEFNTKTMHLGYFTKEIDAGKAYDTAAIKYFGEFARLNFGDKDNG